MIEHPNNPTYNELINHMIDKNISFELITTDEAIQFMKSKNYYFKVTSYRSNFQKKNGKYQNLDFGYLIELAAIDAQLRRYLFEISMNVEHSIKVMMLDVIQQNESEDAYSIVHKFREKYEDFYEQTLSYLSTNSYSKSLYKKHSLNPSIWVLIELMSFGALTKFVEFYNSKYTSKKLNVIASNMKYSKNIRNAVAHSSPILINLFNNETFIKNPEAIISTAAIKFGLTRDDIQHAKINDLVALFSLNKILTSERALFHSRQNGNKFMERYNRHLDDYFTEVPSIKKFGTILNQIIDNQVK
ncbi:Abi family protein [Leuconostoc citreum]|uniref:Abi family protein n=1 Tax=Leuconostoc citreum TaxID=33964 RepID=UPI0032DE8FC9